MNFVNNSHKKIVGWLDELRVLEAGMNSESLDAEAASDARADYWQKRAEIAEHILCCARKGSTYVGFYSNLVLSRIKSNGT